MFDSFFYDGRNDFDYDDDPPSDCECPSCRRAREPEPWDIWYGYPDEGDYLADEAEREAREAPKWAHYGYDDHWPTSRERRVMDNKSRPRPTRFFRRGCPMRREPKTCMLDMSGNVTSYEIGAGRWLVGKGKDDTSNPKRHTKGGKPSWRRKAASRRSPTPPQQDDRVAYGDAAMLCCDCHSCRRWRVELARCMHEESWCVLWGNVCGAPEADSGPWAD